MLTRALSITSLLLALACIPPEATVSNPSSSPSEPFKPTLSLRPVSVGLIKGGTQAFQAEINYPEGTRYMRQPVAWSVVEPEGGTINAAGLYTAPDKAGTYHVLVKREDFPEVTATATVTVK